MPAAKNINNWSRVDFNNAQVQAILKKMMAKISDIQDQALADLAKLKKEKKEIIAKIEKRSDDEKIQAILKKIK
jgi:uncharacterized protein YeeX (DUF496 family)